MGYEYQGTCYASEPQALDAYFGARSPSITEDASGTLITGFESVNGQWMLQQLHVDQLGQQTLNFQTAAQIPAFFQCLAPNDNTANFLQGMELGAAVSAAMVIVWCIRAIRPYR